MESIDAPCIGEELPQLTGSVDWQRVTLRIKYEGLTYEQLRTRAVPPSNLSLLGLVRHWRR
jgi:hypothetical protein